MATYAQPQDLREYASGDPDAAVPEDDEEVERLLARAEIVVDEVIGGVYDDDLLTGRKLDPGELLPGQATALSRATCAAATHELHLGRAVLEGTEEYSPADVQVVIRPIISPPPQTLRELAGHGLIKKSGCVATPEVTA